MLSIGDKFKSKINSKIGAVIGIYKNIVLMAWMYDRNNEIFATHPCFNDVIIKTYDINLIEGMFMSEKYWEKI